MPLSRRTSNVCLTLLPLYILAFPLLALVQGEQPSAKLPQVHRGFLRNHCFECHDAASRKGQLDLENVSFDFGTIESAERWQKILGAVNSGEMPPKESKQAGFEAKANFLEALSGQLVVARQILSDSGGVITMRRLNRREYANTIRSLLGVEVNLHDLPSDADPGNFDTSGSSLFISSDQIEKYLLLGREALTTLIETKANTDAVELHRECETGTNRTVRNRSNQLLARYKLAQQWRQSDGRPTTDFDFIDESRVQFEEGQYQKQFPVFDEYLKYPSTRSGVAFTVTQGGAMVDFSLLPESAPVGEYLIRARVGRLPDAPPDRCYIEYGNTQPGASTGELSVRGCRKVTGSLDAPEIIEFPFTVRGDDDRKIGIRERQHNSRDAARTAFKIARKNNQKLPPPAIWLDWVEIVGPINREQTVKYYDQLFAGRATDNEQQAARQILKAFATQAFRSKTPSNAYLDRLVSLYSKQKTKGLDFEQAMITPLSVILASPSFLYLQEPNDSHQRRELTDRELAVRLSYLLWSAPPDQRLLQLAADGRLGTPSILRAETNRLLADARSMEFIRSFTHQWLQLERLDFFQFNFLLFPQFDESVKMATREEVFQTFASLLKNGRGLGQLLHSKHVVINDLLADYYQLPTIDGHQFQRIKLPIGSPRGGLLGMAAVLAMGSDGERTSPVERGAWVLRKLLHDPPPPAPPNVPQLSRLNAQLLSARELQSAHMEEPQCAQCHRKIDPIGYGLQNFDAAGKWREEEVVYLTKNKKIRKTSKHPIDPSGTLPDGTSFTSYFEMRKRIANNEADFARGFAESLIAYGLGRPYGFSDRVLADQMLQDANAAENEIGAFIHSLIQSQAFRRK
ncbi:MAG: DUF1592 domain-containing protein [Rubripirellula sp.]|nr:DUF1592 domain-containing protein [Rubripirellula sp.]